MKSAHTHSTTHNSLSVGGGLELVNLLWAGGRCWWTGRALRSRGDKRQNGYNSECRGILSNTCRVTATWCFCVHFGSIRAHHLARNEGFSALLLVQAGLKQHGASQWDGTRDGTKFCSSKLRTQLSFLSGKLNAVNLTLVELLHTSETLLIAHMQTKTDTTAQFYKPFQKNWCTEKLF